MSWYQVERMLLKRDDNAAAALGADQLARSIGPEAIVRYLAAIRSRGKIGMAHGARAYIGAAFAFGMKSEHDYTRRDLSSRWGIVTNPAAAIPTDLEALRVGDRFLTPREFRLFWAWLVSNNMRSGSVSAIQLIMVTGQRVQEILSLTETQYDRLERLLIWKNQEWLATFIAFASHRDGDPRRTHRQ
ncbi:hypothetical protein HBA54_17810 [Pelagibius litoralis]|uniref:Phage integrase family protein n=1 Tax=Pelagibius litoralis TaxID=374515 RepID=A0A967KGL7_9PROT|nr:hypothetical protein [Pelagibius litoralis]NIA70456.1 hypothetical protein [Pelagibius litoralis]